jgi:hypothetical protein
VTTPASTQVGHTKLIKPQASRVQGLPFPIYDLLARSHSARLPNPNAASIHHTRLSSPVLSKEKRIVCYGFFIQARRSPNDLALSH